MFFCLVSYVQTSFFVLWLVIFCIFVYTCVGFCIFVVVKSLVVSVWKTHFWKDLLCVEWNGKWCHSSHFCRRGTSCFYYSRVWQCFSIDSISHVFFTSSLTSIYSPNIQLAFSALTLLVGREEVHPASAYKKLSDEVLAWLYVWRKVWMICTWSSWCHCHPIISRLIKIQISLTFLVLVYPFCPGKGAVKWVSYPTCKNIVDFIRSINVYVYELGIERVQACTR